MRINRPVLCTQAQRWRADVARGVPVRAIAQAESRCPATVYYHLGHAPLDAMRDRAVRLEGLFASCNRAIAGATR